MITNAKRLGCSSIAGQKGSNFKGNHSPQTGGPVAPSNGLLHNRTGHSEQANSKSESAQSRRERQPTQLGFSFEKGTEPISGTSQHTSKGELGICDEVESDVLESEISAITRSHSLNPSAMVRLINSTDQGVVISERQLYRHRKRAPEIENSPRQVNMVAYCAWLHWKRHSAPPERIDRRVGNLNVITLGELRQIFESQSYRCALTNDPLTDDNFTLDHIVPVSEGGDFTASNCQLVLTAVNRAKHTMGQQEFIELCTKIAAHATQVKN